jgi:membrane protein DedA with SNARE-associated domain
LLLIAVRLPAQRITRWKINSSRVLMDLTALVQSVVAFVRDHEVWASPIVFALAFAESLAFLSLVIPAWSALVGIGALIGAMNLNFWPIWIAGSLGAALGDWLSFWLGYHFHDRIVHMWPFTKYPQMLPRGEQFVRKWGVPGIFLGRFSGPLRATVPIAAGAFEMPYWYFQLANFSSAFLWAAVLLLPGTFGFRFLS